MIWAGYELDAVCVYVACQHNERVREVKGGRSDVEDGDYGERGPDADECHAAAKHHAQPDGVYRGTGVLVDFGEEAMIVKLVSILKTVSKGHTVKTEWLHPEQTHRSSGS